VQGADKGQEFATPYEGLNNARIELSLTADGGVSFGTNIPLHFKPLTYCFFLLLKALTLDTCTFDKLEENTRLFTPKQKEKHNIFFPSVENTHLQIIIDYLRRVTNSKLPLRIFVLINAIIT
jgi:hypothetical protein